MVTKSIRIANFVLRKKEYCQRKFFSREILLYLKGIMFGEVVEGVFVRFQSTRCLAWSE